MRRAADADVPIDPRPRRCLSSRSTTSRSSTSRVAPVPTSSGWRPATTRDQLAAFQTPAFDDRFRSTTYDARGVGATRSSTPPPWDIAEHALDAAALIEQVCTPPVDLVGLSMGSLISVQLAHDRPELVRCAVVMGTCVKKTGFIREWEEAEIAFRRAGQTLPPAFAAAHYAMQYFPAEVLGDDALWDRITSQVAADFSDRDGEMLAAQWQACLDYDSSELLPRITRADSRRRLLAGRADPTATCSRRRRASRRRSLPSARGPRARLRLRAPPGRRQQLHRRDPRGALRAGLVRADQECGPFLAGGRTDRPVHRSGFRGRPVLARRSVRSSTAARTSRQTAARR